MSVNDTDPNAMATDEPNNATPDGAADFDARVRARAHQIWEDEGRPDGRDPQHWDQAQRELAEADEADSDPARKAETAHADAFKAAFGRS